MVMPLALLEKTVDKRISLLLKDGRVLEGKLTGYDEYMNMVLDETVERTASADERRLGTVVLRGNNVVSIIVKAIILIIAIMIEFCIVINATLPWLERKTATPPRIRKIDG